MELYHTVLLVILYAFIFTFGIIGNIVIITYFGFKMKRDSSFRWFIIQLSIADCICCIITPSFWFYLLVTRGQWNLGLFICKVFTPLGSLTVNVSAWILCGIAYERYRAIVHPLKQRFSKKVINIFCFSTWVVSFLVTIPYFLYAKIHENGKCLPVFTSKQQLTVALIALIAQSIIPIVFMAAIFVSIQSAFREKVKTVSKGLKTELIVSQDGESKKPGNSSTYNVVKSREKVTTQTLRIAVFIFILCSLPYNIFYVVAVYMFRFNQYTTEEKVKYIPVYDRFNFWLGLLVICNSVMNCFIYAGKFPAFRKYLINLCRTKNNRNNEQNDSCKDRETTISPMVTRIHENQVTCS